jgi:hypothetical protein
MTTTITGDKKKIQYRIGCNAFISIGRVCRMSQLHFVVYALCVFEHTFSRRFKETRRKDDCTKKFFFESRLFVPVVLLPKHLERAAK